MKIHLVTFATDNYINSQKNLSKSALDNGVDYVHEYTPNNIDDDFIKKNNIILNDFKNRGAGFWCWKPWVIIDVMKKINNNDVVIYSDIGATIISNITPLIDIVKDVDILLFKVHNCLIKSYTKRDALFYMDCDNEDFYNKELTNGAFQVYKKNEKSLVFLEKYLYVCTNVDIISDNHNICGLPNIEGFLDHRHDQSVLSLLSIKNGIPLYRDPSNWGVDFLMENSNNYGQIFNHHRIKN